MTQTGANGKPVCPVSEARCPNLNTSTKPDKSQRDMMILTRSLKPFGRSFLAVGHFVIEKYRFVTRNTRFVTKISRNTEQNCLCTTDVFPFWSNGR